MNIIKRISRTVANHGVSMQTRLVVIFLLVKIIPLILLTLIAWHQFMILGEVIREIAVIDSSNALNNDAVKNIERMTTDTAKKVAEFLYRRDGDIRYLARLEPTEENYRAFVETARSRLVRQGRWALAGDGSGWIDMEVPRPVKAGVSTNPENNIDPDSDDRDGFHAIPPETFEYIDAPIYDEITFIDLEGNELVKVVASDSPKRRYPMDQTLKNVSVRENTYVRAETYFPRLKELNPGEIYVSDVIGAYVGTNFIGKYTPANVARAAGERGYDISYAPEDQAFSGQENPVGRRFEGIVRWATPVTGSDGRISGYVTLALNHDHIMEFVDHITPMDERYTELPDASEGNYAFIWDYQCRSISHPRHHSIIGFDPETGDPQIPWLEASIYEGWQKSGKAKWFDYVRDYPVFHQQSREKRPAAALTRAGLVGLDGRYLNNAPQCTGWMDLTGSGGSGSFYILWSGVWKLNTAAAIPYYTGQYAPSVANGNSRRGFGFVAIGSGLDYFKLPAETMEARLAASINENMMATVKRLIITTVILTAMVILIALWMAWGISRPIRNMAEQMSRLAIGDIADESILKKDSAKRDEIGLLARSLQDLIRSRRDEFDMANAIAAGDYTRSIPLKSDVDRLGKAFNAMVRINKTALTHVNQAVEEVGEGAVAVSDVSESLAQGVETSESVIKRIAETIDTVDRQAQENATHAQSATELANASRHAAQRGYDAVTELANAMAEIQQAGKKIASVAKLIDDIAFQTNLLALNASVEAARAGRHGKGFSVVADEVRSLSARSAKAAHETGAMVAAMVALMETGAQQAEHSDREFQDIVETATQLASLIENITEASTAQSSAMTQIVQSLGQIDAVTQENSQNAKQMSDSAAALSLQAEELRQMISHFRLKPK